MIMPEQFIYELQKKIERLEKELKEAQEDIQDFELTAKTFKDAYTEIERGFRISMANKDQIIAELEKELLERKGLFL